MISISNLISNNLVLEMKTILDTISYNALNL